MDQQQFDDFLKQENLNYNKKSVEFHLKMALDISEKNIPNSALNDFCQHNIKKALKYLNEIKSKKELINGNGNSPIPK